jgi:hypothetical protein
MTRDILKIPLTRIKNEWIERGEYPKSWKEAVITPILKKEPKQGKKTIDQLDHYQWQAKCWRRLYLNRQQGSWKSMICFQKIKMVFEKSDQ